MSTRDPLEALRAELSELLELDPHVRAALTTPIDARVKERIVGRLQSGQRSRRRARRAFVTGGAFVLCVSVAWISGLESVREQLRAGAGLEQQHPPPEAAEAARLTREAESLREQQHYGEAVELLERALSMREHALGPNHLEVAANLTELAELYRKQQLPAKAERLYRRAYEIQPTAVF